MDRNIQIIEIKNLHKYFDKTHVLKGINLSLCDGEILGILGESGCGKSTLLGAIAGFFDIDLGEITINHNLVAKRGFFLPPKKREVGILFQDYALFPHLNVEQNILFGLSDLQELEQQSRLNEMLQILELEGLQKRYPHELSGGQAQRVALARSIAPRPKIILFDEPFSSLNHALSVKMRNLVKQVTKKYHLSAILVTHNREDAFFLSDRIALIQKGEILESGTPKELYENPKNLQVAQFLGAVNYIEDINSISNLSFRQWLIEKKGLFRPKDLQISSSDGGIVAQVIDNIFFGDWVEVVVEIDGHKISLQSNRIVDSNQQIYLNIIN